MSDNHEFFTRQHQQLNSLVTRMVMTKTDLDAARSATAEQLKAKREKASATRETFQARLAVPVNKMKASVEARKGQTDAAIQEWKRKREVNNLENRALDLEDYAEAAMSVLDFAQDEAAQASLEAVEARRLAEEAKAVTA